MTSEEFRSYVRRLPGGPSGAAGAWSGWAIDSTSTHGLLVAINTFSATDSQGVRYAAAATVTEVDVRAYLDRNLDGPVIAALRDAQLKVQVLMEQRASQRKGLTLP